MRSSMDLEVVIDHKSGFCFGVVNAIEAVEENLQKYNNFYCLGDIVHNEEEIQRLSSLGLNVTQIENIHEVKDSVVLIRAHGEPPSTYSNLKANGNIIVDATCPIVLKLQERVKHSWQEMKVAKGQIVVFGKKGHPEVVGLSGQTDEEAIIVSDEKDFRLIDMSRPVRLYSQTTKSREKYDYIAEKIKATMSENGCHDFVQYKTICGQVANRVPHLRNFAPEFDVFIFVSGESSSNGKYLYSVVKEVNDNSYFITSVDDIKNEWFSERMRVGISGATSTPSWLLENIANYIKAL